jgi:hypothetical protein
MIVLIPAELNSREVPKRNFPFLVSVLILNDFLARDIGLAWPVSTLSGAVQRFGFVGLLDLYSSTMKRIVMSVGKRISQLAPPTMSPVEAA